MSGLILRAEQGVLGALLARRHHALISDAIHVDDLAHPTHKAIYTALLDLQLRGYDTDQLATAIADTVDRPEVDAAWLRDLAAAAPDRDRIKAYARILVQASFDRDTAEFGQPYLDAAEISTDPATRQHLARLGHTLAVQAETFAPRSTIDPQASVRLTVAAHGFAGADLHREDQIIADVLQHPDQARAVAPWLDSAVFTIPQRRLAFELAVSIAYDHDPLDSVILAWHVQRARPFATPHDPDQQSIGADRPSDFEYLRRLETATVTAGTAVIVGRQLLTEHVQATLALSATHAAERAAQAPTPAVPPARPVPPLEPAPTVQHPRIQL